MKKHDLYFSLIILLVCFVGFYFIPKSNLMNDEIVHFEKIQEVFNGDYKQHHSITNIQGYHVVVGLLVKTFGEASIVSTRLVSFFLSLICILIFYLGAKKYSPNHYLQKTLEFVSLPILSIFFYVIYTDVFALLWLLLGLSFYSNKKFILALISIAISVFIRQTYIVFLAMMYAMIIFESCDYDYKKIFSTVIKYKKLNSVFLICLVGFILFVFYNHGIAMGDKENHQVGFNRPANIYFCLNIFFGLNFFSIISKIKTIIKYINTNWKYIIPLFILYSFIVKKTFVLDHVFNARWAMDGFIRMRVLYYFLDTNIGMAILILTSFISILYILSTTKLKSNNTILSIFTFIYLIPLWLVEQRYYLPFYVIYIFFKEKEKPLIVYLQIALNILVTAYLLYNIYIDKFFL